MIVADFRIKHCFQVPKIRKSSEKPTESLKEEYPLPTQSGYLKESLKHIVSLEIIPFKSIHSKIIAQTVA